MKSANVPAREKVNGTNHVPSKEFPPEVVSSNALSASPTTHKEGNFELITLLVEQAMI